MRFYLYSKQIRFYFSAFLQNIFSPAMPVIDKSTEERSLIETIKRYIPTVKPKKTKEMLNYLTNCSVYRNRD